MKRCAIAKIVVEPSGALFVFPEVGEMHTYEYIYREANGLRWDRQQRAICAFEPSRWEHAELLRHIAATLRDAFGEELCFTQDTSWVGASPELQERLRKALGEVRVRNA